MPLTRRAFLKTSPAAILPLALLSRPARAGEPPVYAVNGIALGGTDTVAYFTEGKAISGMPAFSHHWMGAIWQFSSAENRDLFAANPEAYAPQFGGYCAYAVSRNYTAPTDKRAFSIHEGKLYLNYSRPVRALWAAKKEAHIRKGHANWPAVLNQ